MMWVAKYLHDGVEKSYRFGAGNYFMASVKFWAHVAFKGGNIALLSITEDTNTSFSEN